MRSSLIYGTIILCCAVITTVEADKKWKVYETEEEKIKKKDEIINRKLEKLKTKHVKVVDSDSSEESHEEKSKKSTSKVENKASKNEKDKKPVKQVNDHQFSEEKHDSKNDKSNIKKGKDEPPQKKFIGRIEHGKVMVLRIKEDKTQNIKDSEEDPKAKVCRKSKGGKKDDCDNDEDNEKDGSSEEDDGKKSKKKIKYSIKFQHEKQKKKENNGDSRIMRLHKNGKKYGKLDDDDEASDEDESPMIKRRITYDDED